MSDKTAKEIGDALELYVKQELGGELIAQSGAGKFFKLDNKAGIFVIECKGTTKQSMTIRKTWLRNLVRAARSILGGGHTNVNGALVIEIDGLRGVLVDFDVFKDLITRSEEMQYLTPDKATQRQDRASGSLL